MNRNTLWARVLIDELVRAGVRHACIAPGSRSTPLTLAAAEHPALTCSVHLDERSAAFFALGIALASERPPALICTSGTAAANFFPAIIEARQSRVPLIVLTADRPHELRDSGANQTIVQPGLYGSYPLWSVDVALPEATPSPLLLRYLRTVANRAVAISCGTPKGVVHLNLPFRKPLEPTPVATDVTALPPEAEARLGPFSAITPLRPAPPEAAQLAQLAELLRQHPQGIIVCGPNLRLAGFAEAVAQLAVACGYPILADPLSGVRFSGHPAVIGGYDTILSAHPEALGGATLALRFGELPTSQALSAALTRLETVIHIAGDGIWSDDSHRLSAQLCCDPIALCRGLAARLPPASGNYLAYWQRLEAASWQLVEQALAAQPFFDGAAVYQLLSQLPPESTLLLGNSLPVRHADQFGRPQPKRYLVRGNRGASGIDGNVSTALGLGYARPEAPLVALLGDLTFYHDMNGLLAAKLLALKPLIVLLNNGGGGIFARLPVRATPHFRRYFLTPHQLDFAHSAALYDLAHRRLSDRGALAEALAEALVAPQGSLIEVMSEAEHDLAQRQALLAAVREGLTPLIATP